MKALTLIQPWAWCVAHAGKRVENRTWAPSPLIFDGRLAIHAGKTVDFDALSSLEREGIIPDYDLARGAVVATARVLMCAVGDADQWRAHAHWTSLPPGAYDSAKKLIAVRDGLWFSGPVGWVLNEVVTLRVPVPCRGAQGLWNLPPSVAEAVQVMELASK